jgi:hypothetical protein
LLDAVSLSDEHNRHCRAGTPIDGAVQQARQDLQQALAALLALEGAELSRRDELVAAGQGLARFTGNPLARLPVVVIHTAVARWLAPDDADVMRVAFNDPELPAHERLRIEHRVAVTSARQSLATLKMLLEGAHDAHVAAPSNPALKATYQKWLHKTYVAMELVFDEAMKERSVADAAVQTARSLQRGFAHEQRCNVSRARKQQALMVVATDLKTVARLRLNGLKALCLDLQTACDNRPGDRQRVERLATVQEELRKTATLLAACAYVAMA